MENIDIAAMKRLELEQFAMDQSLEVKKLSAKVDFYEEQIRLMQRQKFGAKSEQADPNQLSFFNDPEAEATEDAKEPKMSQVKPPKQKKQTGRKEQLTASLPKETVTYTLTAEEQVCPVCHEPLHEMKKIVRKELEIIPAKVFVKEHIQQVYSCRNCEQHAIHTPILSAPMPAPLISGSILSPSLASYVLCRKYENRDPLHKIAADFHRMGLRISKQTMANWVIKLAQPLGLLYGAMKEELLALPILHADETTVQVLKEPGKTAQSNSYMWVYTSGKDARPILLYEYAPSRSGTVPKAFLGDFNGFLQTDGYAGYGTLDGQAVRVGCFAHVRRYYWAADKALPANSPYKETIRKGVRFCDSLFSLDQEVKDLPADQRLSFKAEKIQPVMEEFFTWAETEAAKNFSKGAYQKALTYTLNQRSYLENYLLDGNLEISNNPAERAIRPFVTGRKQWLFFNTPKGAKAGSIAYSLVETAKANGLLPLEYFTYILDQLRQIDCTDPNEIKKLLPWAAELPPSCRCPSNQEEGTNEQN